MKLSDISGTIEIHRFDPESYDIEYDPWVVADQADAIAKNSGIGITRDKELTYVALVNDNAVGGVWSSTYQDDTGRTVLDFDVVVDKNFRGARIGLQLIEIAMSDLHELEEGSYIRVWVVNPKLVRVLERKYGFDVESQYPDGTAHLTYGF